MSAPNATAAASVNNAATIAAAAKKTKMKDKNNRNRKKRREKEKDTGDTAKEKDTMQTEPAAEHPHAQDTTFHHQAQPLAMTANHQPQDLALDHSFLLSTLQDLRDKVGALTMPLPTQAPDLSKQEASRLALLTELLTEQRPMFLTRVRKTQARALKDPLGPLWYETTVMNASITFSWTSVRYGPSEFFKVTGRPEWLRNRLDWLKTEKAKLQSSESGKF
ncbi:hypothetical protein N0V87_006049 [Didymella glomerata]|uniref:Uncharacterized protein n=1 Tax=Didymella glomerata TaxID=749621 RepID=A0A9W8WYP0_9PLEO|nr:hypothetical protein N0V87_006049 [Didymella glomerata]